MPNSWTTDDGRTFRRFFWRESDCRDWSSRWPCSALAGRKRVYFQWDTDGNTYDAPANMLSDELAAIRAKLMPEFHQKGAKP